MATKELLDKIIKTRKKGKSYMLNEKITQSLMDSLTEQAKVSPRLRMNYDLRDSDMDGSQRMLNAIEPGSVLPIHRHQKTSETMVCLRGKLRVEYYDGKHPTPF